MRAAHYSRAVQLGLAVSFIAAGALAAYAMLRASTAPEKVALDVADLRARSAELVTILEEVALDRLTTPFLHAQRRQWRRAVLELNGALVAVTPPNAHATLAHEAAVELMRIGDAIDGPAGTFDRASEARQITERLIAQERALAR